MLIFWDFKAQIRYVGGSRAFLRWFIFDCFAETNRGGVIMPSYKYLIKTIQSGRFQSSLSDPRKSKFKMYLEYKKIQIVLVLDYPGVFRLGMLVYKLLELVRIRWESLRI